MLRFTRTCLSLTFVIALGSLHALAYDSAPPWLQQAARLIVPGYEKEVDAVVLLNEEVVTLDSNGKLTTVERRAIRVLQKEGVRDAIARAFYLSKFSKVDKLEAWLIAPGGAVTSYGKKETIDIISDPDDVYDEGRIKSISAVRDADVGYIFGYTSTTETRPLFYQHQWLFQDNHPTLISRFTLNLPQGWKMSNMTFNREEIVPQSSGSSHTWELRDLPPIALEPLSPAFVNIAPRVAINYAPEANDQGVNKAFADWLEVAHWATRLYEPQVIIDDVVAAKAQDLTTGLKTEFEKIRAIARFVQNLQYISIDIGVGYGNGMKPRPSNVVLDRGYGDCKDKANLMRALLKAIDIEAYPIAIYSGDPNFVRKEWPSPRQFNHCIIAVKVSDQTEAATIIEHATLGRLMIFDATDPYTPLGDLPDYLQGSNGLLIAGDNGGLIEMPVTPPDFNTWHRETDVVISDNGSIKGTIRERARGQESRLPRTLFRSVTRDDFRKAIERWLTRGATAATLVNLEPADNHDDASFGLDIEFAAPNYGQLMQNRLLIFKPAIANRSNSVYLTEISRTHPIEFESNSFIENVIFELPNGFEVDELPDPVDMTVPFGSYVTSYEIKDGKLLYSRSLITKRMTVPVEKYSDIRSFYSKIRDAEQTPVVLIRK
jgi:hypothetical protein